MRIAHLLPNLVVGGRERFTIDRCRDAVRAGKHACIICYDPDGPGAQLSAADVPLYVVDRRRPDFVSSLAALLRSEQIDELHAQGHVAAALAAPIAREWPVHTTLHGARGIRWRWLPAIARGLRRSQTVSAVSDDLARRYRWLAGNPITVVAAAIDRQSFASRLNTPSNPVFTIGIAARLHPIKRHQDLLSAVRILQMRGVACRLRIAGEGPLATDLRRRALGLDVHFDGHVDDMPGWLSALDAFVLSSDHEGTPLALLEAQAIGLPCIATNVGGIPACRGKKTILVPRRRPQAMADALMTTIAEVGQRAGPASC